MGQYVGHCLVAAVKGSCKWQPL